MTRPRALRAKGVVPLVLLLVAATMAHAGDLELEELRFLLGPRVHVGELAPVRARVKAGPRGFTGELGAQGGGLGVFVPLALPAGRTADVVLPGTGGGAGLKLVARPEGGEPFALPAPGVQVLERWMPVVALGPDVPDELRRVLAPPGSRSADEPADVLELAAHGGGALDVLVLGRGASDRLAAFAAEGGAIVVPDPATLEGLAAGAGPRRDTELLARRSLGGGILVAPLSSAGLAAIPSSLSLHAHARRDVGAIGAALADAWAAPSTTPRLAGKIAVKTALVLAALSLALAVAPPKRRVAAFVLASLALTALVPFMVLGGTARAPVYLETATVLEAAPDGTLAGVTETLRLGSPRRAFATVELAKGTPLAPVSGRAGDALAELHLEPATTLEPAPARLRVPLGPGLTATFARRSVRSLEGAVSVSASEVRNGLPWRLERPLLLVGKDLAVELDDLAPGETRRVTTPPVSYTELLGKRRASPTFDEVDRRRLALLAAAAPDRSSSGTPRLVGFVTPPTAARARDGVLEEGRGETLLVVGDR